MGTGIVVSRIGKRLAAITERPRCATGSCRDHWHTLGHRLQHTTGHAFAERGENKNIGGIKPFDNVRNVTKQMDLFREGNFCDPIIQKSARRPVTRPCEFEAWKNCLPFEVAQCLNLIRIALYRP